MHVEAGWAHQVVNLQPCLKVAFDYLKPEDTPLYAMIHRHVFSAHAQTFEAGQDYMGILDILFDEAARLVSLADLLKSR